MAFDSVNFWLSAAVSSLLLLVAVGLMISHQRTWQSARQQQLKADEQDFRRRQFRRRMQTSGMLAVLAVALFAGQLIPGPPLLVFAFWGGVLIVVIWLTLLALGDMWATKHYFGRMRQKYLVEQARLQAELRRIRTVEGNGRDKRRDRPRK